jgi:predicted metal-dependent phosphotriesterase family hydrolase
MDHDGSIARGVYVELDAIGVQHHGPPERRTAVLVLVP